MFREPLNPTASRFALFRKSALIGVGTVGARVADTFEAAADFENGFASYSFISVYFRGKYIDIG
jgi:hypothetical protein